MQKTFTFKRWVSTILAIVMLLGLVPTATLASAGGGTHGGSTGDAGAAGTNPQGWNWDYNAFSRYTLIKLPSGANNPSEYQVIGTVDIVDSAYENRLTDAPDSMLWVGTSYADGAYTKTAGMNTCLLYTSDAADE